MLEKLTTCVGLFSGVCRKSNIRMPISYKAQSSNQKSKAKSRVVFFCWDAHNREIHSTAARQPKVA
jgi:hypothetical protein